MSINSYTPCPCGSGKKIKFCCGDLAADIDRILRMLEGDQRVAALRLIDQLLEKHPDRIALLDIKTNVALELDQLDTASEAIHRVLEIQPNHAVALIRRAQLEALRGDAMRAVVTLQRGMQMTDGAIPSAALEAYFVVGQALWAVGHIIAARAHLNTQFFLQRDAQDPRGISAILEMNHHGGLPLLVKDDLRLTHCPTDAPWKEKFEESINLAGKLKWRAAVELLEPLIQESDSAPCVVFNLAVIQGWLADTHGMVEGLRKYATMEVPEEKAVEALALANLLDHGHDEDSIDRIERCYRVEEVDRLIETLLSDSRASKVPDENMPQHEDSPPPLASFTLLDRAMPEASEDLTGDQIPIVLGLISIYGKETARDSRLVFVTTGTETLETSYQQLESLVGSFVSDPKDEVIGKLDRVYNAMAPRWQMPLGVPAKTQLRLMQEQLHESIVQTWPEIPQRVLDGKTPDEASKIDSLKIPLLAAVLVMETTSLASSAPKALAELRERLGIPAQLPIDPAAEDFNAWDLPISRLSRVDLEKASDKDLLQFYRRVKIAGVGNLIAQVLREYVKRPALEQYMDKMESYAELVQVTESANDALAVIKEARIATSDSPHSRPTWDIAEMTIYLQTGEAENAMSILEGLNRDFPDDMNVRRAVHEVLSSFGFFDMLREQGGMPDAAGGILQESSATSEIWTPGQESSSASGDKPAIWTP